MGLLATRILGWTVDLALIGFVAMAAGSGPRTTPRRAPPSGSASRCEARVFALARKSQTGGELASAGFP